ncbi:HAD family hydrolase [Streptomyces sp. bgisy159]|uniref:HAD family hydrolase n=1 Tax=Streptomyces sp. bgisy159 TaxID=3413795 RepID=UPI003F49D002
MTADTGRTDLVTSEADDLRELVARTRYVLFDFDGPICALFPGDSGNHLSEDQLSLFRARGLLGLLTDEERIQRDAYTRLSAFGRRHPRSDLFLELEERLTQHELRAVRHAMPTAYADPLIRTWVATGTRLAVVTNNSARTVNRYLHSRGLLPCFAPHVYGRTQDMSLLKPHPHTLHRALEALGAAPGDSLMIGDTVTDHAAARDAGVRFIGYARNDVKEHMLLRSGVEHRHVVRSLEPLLRAVRAHA